MPFVISRPVNIPPMLMFQSSSLACLSLYMIYRRRGFAIKTADQNTAEKSRVGDEVSAADKSASEWQLIGPTRPDARAQDAISLCGIAGLALESMFWLSSYMPPQENQFLHASVPVRGTVALLIGALLLKNRKTMSKEGFWELAFLMVMDGTAAISWGFFLGRWDGIVSGKTAKMFGQ